MEFNREFFDAGIYRVGTQSTKWDGIRKDCGKDDIVPLWVADMDFPSPPAVQRALLARAAHGTYGYTLKTDEDMQAMVDFWARRHNVTLEKEDIVMIPGVITGIRTGLLYPDSARGRRDYPKPRVRPLPLLRGGHRPQGHGKPAGSPCGWRL